MKSVEIHEIKKLLQASNIRKSQRFNMKIFLNWLYNILTQSVQPLANFFGSALQECFLNHRLNFLLKRFC